MALKGARMTTDELSEKYIDHEVRIRLHDHKYEDLKKLVKDTHRLLLWILGTVITSVFLPIIVPIVLNHLHKS